MKSIINISSSPKSLDRHVMHLLISVDLFVSEWNLLRSLYVLIANSGQYLPFDSARTFEAYSSSLSVTFIKWNITGGFLECEITIFQVVTVTKFQGGETFNVIPDSVTIGGTFRALSKESFSHLKQRIEEVCLSVGQFRLHLTFKFNNFLKLKISKWSIHFVPLISSNAYAPVMLTIL